MAKTNLKTYDMTFRVVAIIGTEVQASNMEEAIQKAKELKETDYFKVQESIMMGLHSSSV